MRQFLFKNKWLIVFILICVAISLSVDIFTRNIFITTASQVVGAPVSADYFDFSIVKSSIVMRGLKLYNPANFPQGILADLKEVRVDYNLSALLKKELHFPLIVIDLNEMVIIKDKNGKLNIDSLKIVRDKPESPPAERQRNNGKAQSLPMRIDMIKLNINRVVYKDFSISDKGQILVYDADIKNKIFKNITTPQQLATLIMVKAMEVTAIKGAAIYGAAATLGIAFLPVGVAGILFSKSHAREDFQSSYAQVYQVCDSVVKDIGTVKMEKEEKGIIQAIVYGADVQIALKSLPDGKVRVTVSARKMTLPKPEIAAGVLYQIAERLK
jgi:hypothetical protein